MHYKDIDYIAFEGGGGKGIVYLGAVRALEKANKLPLSKADRVNDSAKLRFRGIGGSSAGAITCYFLALGMSADDILAKTRQINKETKKPEFYCFYDDAQPALYKGVTYDERLEANVPCYIVDVPKVDREDILYIDSGRA